MPFVLQFQPTFADVRRLTRGRGRGWFVLVRRLIAAALVWDAVVRLRSTGLDWSFPLSLLVAVYLAVPIHLFEIAFGFYLSIWRPTTEVTIDEERTLLRAGKHEQTIPWSSYRTNGSATEDECFFQLECGRGGVCIPKRAFRDESEMTAFREFVRDKMGERCRFARNDRVGAGPAVKT